MGLRTSTELTLKVGLENALDDLVFDRDLSEILDTLEHGAIHKLTLEAGTTNWAVPFGDVLQARLVYVEADGEFEVAFGGSAATAAQVDAVGATYPTSFVGGETLLWDLDNVGLMTVTFDAADQSLAQVVNRINSIAALNGHATPVASANGGQLRLTSPTTGATSEIDIQGGTGLATLGLSIGVTVGVNANPGTSNVAVTRPADPAGATAAQGVTAFFLGTVNTTSLQLTNPSATADLNVKVCVVGDLTT